MLKSNVGDEAKMEIQRGNTKYAKFQRHYCGGEVITEQPEKIYFSIKYDHECEEPLVQKKLNDGITFNTKDNYYYITIKPDDTENLPYGDYVYDVKVINGEYKQTIAKGNVTISEIVTYARNEV